MVVFSDGTDLLSAPSSPSPSFESASDSDSEEPHSSFPPSADLESIQNLYPNLFGIESKRLKDVHVKELLLDTPGLKTQDSRFPKVYFPPQADVESESATIVGMKDQEVDLGRLRRHVGSGAVGSKKGEGAGENKEGVGKEAELHDDFVVAMHAFAARSAKEMTMLKGDIIYVHKRQGTWIYGTKIPPKTPDSTPSTEETLPTETNSSSSKQSNSFRNIFRKNSGKDEGEPNAAGNEGEAEKLEMGWIPVAFVTKYSFE
ncbi:hypothetical protein HDV05_000359 [Chytridiales sp. JEL 0842]|nr:hypothetical protein HDV05_000359 [Chytridiales sp. JEL 0842]